MTSGVYRSLLMKKRDEVKKKLCEEHGIRMFYITKKNYSLNEILKYIDETSKQEKTRV